MKLNILIKFILLRLIWSRSFAAFRRHLNHYTLEFICRVIEFSKMVMEYITIYTREKKYVI